MKQNKRILLACMAVTMMFGAGTAFATSAFSPEFSSSLNPVGSGARATGMGGAFIAVADDATAASWNPAGLVHLEKPEMSLVYSYQNRGQATRNSDLLFDVQNTNNSMDSHDINFASVAYPFQLLNRNMVVTLSYQQLYNMNKSVDLNLSQSTAVLVNNIPTGSFTHDSWTSSFTQNGFISAISPAIAMQILPELYLGATVNIWDNVSKASSWNNSSKNHLLFADGTTVNYQQDSKYEFSGLNANLGLIYNLKSKYSFGLVYKTHFNADLKTKTTTILTGDLGSDFSIDDEKQKMSMPASYGFGFAYRHSDNLSMALDIYRTEWSHFAITDSSGNKKNPISGNYMSVPDPVKFLAVTGYDPTMGGKPHDTTQVRIGGEYLFIGDKMTVPFRAGVFYDPEPGQVKVDDFFGVSAGSGLSFDKYSFDVSYQYRWGNRVSGDIQNETFSADIHQHTAMASLIYHF